LRAECEIYGAEQSPEPAAFAALDLNICCERGLARSRREEILSRGTRWF